MYKRSNSWLVMVFCLMCGFKSIAQLSLKQTSWTGVLLIGDSVKVKLQFGPELFRIQDGTSGNVIETMKYRQSNDTLFITKLEGQSNCGSQEGIYKLIWLRNGGGLSFKVIQDSCEQRSQVLDGAVPFNLVALRGRPTRDWTYLDLASDSLPGISLYKAYALLKGRQAVTVVVGVLDEGIDLESEDLKDNIWRNAREIAGNGKDDDGNGYIDDIRGWNYIGAVDGRPIDHDQLEETRIYWMWRGKFDGQDRKQWNENEKKQFDLFQQAKNQYEASVSNLQAICTINRDTARYFSELEAYEPMMAGKPYTKALLKQLPLLSQDSLSRAVGSSWDRFYSNRFKTYTEEEKAQISLFRSNSHLSGLVSYIQDVILKYDYGTAYDPRGAIAPDPTDPGRRYYGNPAVIVAPNVWHGTFVAGIIGATRGNNKGIDGIADHVKMIPLCVLPNQGDERDSVVAKAIIYAVDNGARVINMSFAKKFSPYKQVVDKAVRYAEKSGVLLFRAAGNDASNDDSVNYYPNPGYDDSGRASNFMVIGCSTQRYSDELVKYDSNFGPSSVDLFAPGTDVFSVQTGNNYDYRSGSSFAAPCAAGVAALLFSYFPQLTASQVKDILIRSSFKPDLMVNIPNAFNRTTDRRVPFRELSSSGGLLNAYEAVKMAIAMTNSAAKVR